MRGFFRKNLGLKLLSLLIAISLEIYFMSPQNLVTETFNAQVELEGLTPQYKVVWPPAAAEGLVVACKVRGPGPLVQELRATPRKLKISFPEHPPRVFLTALDIEQLRLPSGVELLEAQPTKLEFRVDPVVEREVKVRLNFSGQIPSGLRLESYRLEPDAIKVKGPEGEVLLLDEVETESLDLSQVKQTSLVDVGIRDVGGLSELSRRSVRAVLTVQPIMSERSFSSVQISVKAPPDVEVTPTQTKVKVVLGGEERVIKKIQEVEAVAQVLDTNRVVGKRYKERVEPAVVGLPQGVRVILIQPEKVDLTVVRRRQ